jgi:acyl-CoA reductase-like NAD-dependent aldehyde dehydrogenase
VSYPESHNDELGGVAVHLPYGGVEQHGVGKDCSRYSIAEYLTLKRVSVRTQSGKSLRDSRDDPQ